MRQEYRSTCCLRQYRTSRAGKQFGPSDCVLTRSRPAVAREPGPTRPHVKIVDSSDWRGAGPVPDRPAAQQSRPSAPGELLPQPYGEDLGVARLQVDGVDGDLVGVAALVGALLDVDVGVALGERELD